MKVRGFPSPKLNFGTRIELLNKLINKYCVLFAIYVTAGEHTRQTGLRKRRSHGSLSCKPPARAAGLAERLWALRELLTSNTAIASKIKWGVPYRMSNTSKAIIDDYREALVEQYLSLPEYLRKQKFPTTDSAAELTGLSRRTIRFWIENDDINAIFVGKSYRIEFDSLMTFIKKRVKGRNPL